MFCSRGGDVRGVLEMEIEASDTSVRLKNRRWDHRSYEGQILWKLRHRADVFVPYS